MNIDLLRSKLKERFCRYAQVWTTSDSSFADKGTIPSTECQFELAKLLVEELKNIGVNNAELTPDGYVFASINANCDCSIENSVLFCAHMDTSEEVSGKNVNPQIHENYDGTPIYLQDQVILSAEQDSQLAACANVADTIITSDGTTLLGADDKAGIAAIMTAIEYLLSNPEIPHCKIELLFNPDEETGHGMDKVPMDKITSKIGYTVDGGDASEIEAECFNAYCVSVDFMGIAMHFGYARGKMQNAVTMASNFIQMLPRNESPETTDGYEGYYCVSNITGNVETTHIDVMLRDFTTDGMERRIAAIKTFAQCIENQFPGGKVILNIRKQYSNMKEEIDRSPLVLEKLNQAVKNAGGNAKLSPIRGGTDGSRLTEMGIPTPNIFTGGHNFHSRREWLSLNQLELSCKTLIELAKLYAK